MKWWLRKTKVSQTMGRKNRQENDEKDEENFHHYASGGCFAFFFSSLSSSSPCAAAHSCPPFHVPCALLNYIFSFILFDRCKWDDLVRCSHRRFGRYISHRRFAIHSVMVGRHDTRLFSGRLHSAQCAPVVMLMQCWCISKRKKWPHWQLRTAMKTLTHTAHRKHTKTGCRNNDGKWMNMTPVDNAEKVSGEGG